MPTRIVLLVASGSGGPREIYVTEDPADVAGVLNKVGIAELTAEGSGNKVYVSAGAVAFLTEGTQPSGRASFT